MPNIDEDLRKIKEARYGRDVRNAIHDSIHDINIVADEAHTAAIDAQNSAQASATLARSYTEGDTGTRPDEDTDNARYYKEFVERVAGNYTVDDTLESTSTIHALSANQGHVLDGKISTINGKVGAANGIASLDANGRVPYQQLPESAMEFKGTWDANTNTPTLTQGVGTNGDFYVVSVAGTWDSTEFEVGDRILFDSEQGSTGLWVKLSGSGGGHVIKDESGASMTQRKGLQFVDAHLSDDSTNNDTEIEIVKQVTPQELANLGNNTDGFYDDGEPEDYITAENIEYRSGTTTKQALDRIEGNFGNIENGDTSSQAYTVGEYIVRNDVFYRVKASIAQGDSFTVGANIEVITLNSKFTPEYVEVIADGVKTASALLNSLASLIDTTKLSHRACLTIGGEIYVLAIYNTSAPAFSHIEFSGGLYSARIRYAVLSTGSILWEIQAVANSNNTKNDMSNTVFSNGTVLRVYY